MKDSNLLEHYKLYLKMLTIFMPAISVLIILIGIVTGIVVAIIMKKVFWFGFIIIGFGLFLLVEYFLIRKYILKKINHLTNKKDGEQ